MDLREYQMWLARESLQPHGEARTNLEWGRTRALLACQSGKPQKLEQHVLFPPEPTKAGLLKQIEAFKDFAKGQ